MIIRFIDQQQQPMLGAVVSIAQAPGTIQDIGMITDNNGTVSIDVTEPGDYVFSVFYNGQKYQVSSTLKPQNQDISIVVG